MHSDREGGTMRRRSFVATAAGLAALPFIGCATGRASGKGARLATFTCDATPPLGGTLIWIDPENRILDPLLLKGLVLEEAGRRYVIAALDWCLVCNESERLFRETLARAAGTEPACVAIQCVHQHTAPYADEGAFRFLATAPGALPRLAPEFLRDLQGRMARAVSAAVKHLEPFDQVGRGLAAVQQVASYRRVRGADGKLFTRYSESTPELRALPEGPIDPFVRTVSFARGEKVLARLHYYATHPQTHSCDGSASADFVGAARQALEREEGVFQVYFTGCAGDCTVGKYNDGGEAGRAVLAKRLLAGLKASIAATRYAPAGSLVWRTEKVVLPIRTDAEFRKLAETRLHDVRERSGRRVYSGAMRLASIARAGQPFEINSLQMGNVHLLHLPGEPMVDYQRFAQRSCPDGFVAVAGYGDCGSAYICTDAVFAEGGYEPGATNLAPGAEPLLKQAIRHLLG